MKFSYNFLCVMGLCSFFAPVFANVIPLTAEIRNEQPYSLDNNAIRVRVFNHGADTLKEMSFCYRFQTDKEFVFEDNWYLPDLNYKVDTLTDTTFQIHFWLKQGAFVAPNSYFPNTSGIVFGLHHKYWAPWDYRQDYSYSSNPSFESTDKLFLSVTNECYDDAVVIDTARIKILGYDRDGNGVRDDLDSLIDVKFPNSPEKRAAYRYLAKSIQNQWAAFYENPQMTYEELLPYQSLISLGIALIDDVGAKQNLEFVQFEASLLNTLDRVMYDDMIDHAFIGKTLPVIIKKGLNYPDKVADGVDAYNAILKIERVK